MSKIFLVNKPIGMTPLQCIHKVKQQYPDYADTTLSYAGRLDPMAEGLLLVLVGDENKRRQQYQDLPKEYITEIVLGIATDTYDLLGKITATSIKKVSKNHIRQCLVAYIGSWQQPYPPYSSKPVNGKPLYHWARNNRLNELTIPAKTVKIDEIKILTYAEIPAKELWTILQQRIAKVTGDFRQSEILQTWSDFFRITKQASFQICTIRVLCSSGTYMRSLAHTLGEDVKSHALAFSIKRTRIGNYTLENALHIE